MTEANLRPSWPPTSCTTCIIFGVRSVHNSRKNQLYILLHLVQSALVTVQRGMYTIWWKASCTLPR